jgi:cytochrome c peroxidase
MAHMEKGPDAPDFVRQCPAGFNDTPAMPAHYSQPSVLGMPFQRVFSLGQQIFVTNFNACDGAGRPATTGTGAPRTPDPLMGPRYTRASAPETTSCAGCHSQPQPGGAGDFVANVFVLAQAAIPVSGTILNPDFSDTWLERNTLGMFGSGAIEMAGREMTTDLQAEQQTAIANAKSSGTNVTVNLTTKGVSFGSLTAHPDGTVDTSAVVGVDSDLVIKPFSRKGAFRSLREFTVTAMNQHHGLQAVERFGTDTDPDEDGVTNELLIGDVTAVTIFQAALPAPIVTTQGINQQAARRGSQLFSQVGCAGCHMPSLPLTDTKFCDPDPENLPNTFNDTSQSYCFELAQTGIHGNSVAAFTDLKRHVICDANKPHYCNEPTTILQATDDNIPIAQNQFLTAKLWDVGNSGPWGHRGDLDTIYAAITAHGGEATTSEAAFEALANSDQLAVVTFLKSLQMPILPISVDPNVGMTNQLGEESNPKRHGS